jgi:DNA-binding CsgD family transcriptional regulator
MNTDEQRLQTLSRREVTVIYLKCQGNNLHEIADAIDKSSKTVQYYITNAYKKLELSNFPDKEKEDYLKRLYCPILAKLISTPKDIENWIPLDPKTGRALTIKQRDDDEVAEETGLILWRKGEMVKYYPPPALPPLPPPPPKIRPIHIVIIALLLTIMCVSGTYIGRTYFPRTLIERFIETVQVIETSVVKEEVLSTVIHTEIAYIEVTSTPPPITDTPQPTNLAGTPTPVSPTEVLLTNIVSLFDGNSFDGWQVTAGVVTNPSGSGNTGNDSDGYLSWAERTTDTSLGYFIAPRRYLQDWRTFKELSLDLWSSGGRFFTEGRGLIGDIYIANGTLTAWYNLPYRPPADSWETFVISLEDDELWQFGPGTMSLESVLTNITEFKIRAEYGLGTDQCGLDNVILISKD